MVYRPLHYREVMTNALLLVIHGLITIITSAMVAESHLHFFTSPPIGEILNNRYIILNPLLDRDSN